MMAGWVAAARATFRGEEQDETVEDEGKGWGKVIPRSLLFFSAVDIVSAFVVFATRNYICDRPLRTWLVGGIMLGGPTDLLVKGLAWILKPRYRYYKLEVVNCRDVAPDQFEIEQLEFYDEFGRLVGTRDQFKEGNTWMVQMRWPTMITSYRLMTSMTQPAANDPVSWQLSVSNNKKTWRLIDENYEPVVPMARNTGTALFTELTTLDEDVSFRQAFLAEVMANAAAFAWLVAGSAWIAGSSETCVDSAPELWYYCFIVAVLTWSCLGTVTIGLIVSAVAMILLGVKTA